MGVQPCWGTSLLGYSPARCTALLGVQLPWGYSSPGCVSLLGVHTTAGCPALLSIQHFCITGAFSPAPLSFTAKRREEPPLREALFIDHPSHVPSPASRDAGDVERSSRLAASHSFVRDLSLPHRMPLTEGTEPPCPVQCPPPAGKGRELRAICTAGFPVCRVLAACRADRHSPVSRHLVPFARVMPL